MNCWKTICCSLILALAACQQALEIKDQDRGKSQDTLPTLEQELPQSRSKSPSNDKCEALRERLQSIQEEHANLHDQLEDMRKDLQMCLNGHSDQKIKEGQCDHWEKEMEGVRKAQQQMAKAAEGIKNQIARDCRD